MAVDVKLEVIAAGHPGAGARAVFALPARFRAGGFFVFCVFVWGVNGVLRGFRR